MARVLCKISYLAGSNLEFKPIPQAPHARSLLHIKIGNEVQTALEYGHGAHVSLPCSASSVSSLPFLSLFSESPLSAFLTPTFFLAFISLLEKQTEDPYHLLWEDKRFVRYKWWKHTYSGWVRGVWIPWFLKDNSERCCGLRKEKLKAEGKTE